MESFAFFIADSNQHVVLWAIINQILAAFETYHQSLFDFRWSSSPRLHRGRWPRRFLYRPANSQAPPERSRWRPRASSCPIRPRSLWRCSWPSRRQKRHQHLHSNCAEHAVSVYRQRLRWHRRLFGRVEVEEDIKSGQHTSNTAKQSLMKYNWFIDRHALCFHNPTTLPSGGSQVKKFFFFIFSLHLKS